MIFDTDILIWLQRSNLKAAHMVENAQERSISVQTYMELLQCAPSKQHHQIIRSFIVDYNIHILPLTENIGHRASIYIEQYSLGKGIRAGDAIIAATAVENNQTLATDNRKHYSHITELQCKFFKP